MDYTITAPTFKDVGVPEEDFVAFITNKVNADSAPQPEPTITKVKLRAIGKIFKDNAIAQNNGYVAIAQELGLTSRQVKTLFEELKEAENVIRGELADE